MPQSSLVIVGGGPAGLRAAEVAADAGISVCLYEANPSVGRKFLVAGRGGLNLTHSESIEGFTGRYKGSFSSDFWTSLLSDFDNKMIQDWADHLSIKTFIGTSGRVFPNEKKAAPLLRAWIKSLKESDVTFHTRSKLRLWEHRDDQFVLFFDTPEGRKFIQTDAVLLALGGASWPQTGSDGSWIPWMKDHRILVDRLKPANCGWEHPWDPPLLNEIEGTPLKNLVVSALHHRVRGELLITRYGLEGGALYQLGPVLRSMQNPEVSIDFKPDFSRGELLQKLQISPQENPFSCLRKWKLSPQATTLITHAASTKGAPTPSSLAALVKDFRIPLDGPRPIAEAISSAGGVHASELDENLMVRRFPGLFLAGEMLDWEAPTGGYLLQGCFATATRAANGAVKYLSNRIPALAGL